MLTESPNVTTAPINFQQLSNEDNDSNIIGSRYIRRCILSTQTPQARWICSI
ncbi:hypothetical protein PVAP13_1NG130419 [Panicum virgatum]|uniref:Uncharacterized protein n=1 Tax=Panicum virgatum TaxID=38727 RepID=A0A8T0X2K3_PANVG|nr:hypothetical protein PVAP13_1NG130419 [Panicum virgatum]